MPMDPEKLITFRLSRLADTLNRAASLAYGRRYDLTLTAWRTLAILSGREPTTAKEIAQRSRVDKGWISRSLAELERRGLIERAPNGEDNRSVSLRLTDQGRRLVSQVAPLSRERHETLLAPLPTAEREAFLKALDIIERQADVMLADEDRRWEQG